MSWWPKASCGHGLGLEGACCWMGSWKNCSVCACLGNGQALTWGDHPRVTFGTHDGQGRGCCSITLRIKAVVSPIVETSRECFLSVSLKCGHFWGAVWTLRSSLAFRNLPEASDQLRVCLDFSCYNKKSPPISCLFIMRVNTLAPWDLQVCVGGEVLWRVTSINEDFNLIFSASGLYCSSVSFSDWLLLWWSKTISCFLFLKHKFNSFGPCFSGS